MGKADIHMRNNANEGILHIAAENGHFKFVRQYGYFNPAAQVCENSGIDPLLLFQQGDVVKLG